MVRPRRKECLSCAPTICPIGATPVLEQGLEACDTRVQSSEALLLAHLAEIDARRRYLAQGYSSMCDYCTENADELLAAAAHRSKTEIELLLAQRFPKADAPTRLVAIAPPPVPAPGHRKASR